MAQERHELAATPLAQRPSQPSEADPVTSGNEPENRELAHARALLSCAQELMAPGASDDANRAVLSRALEALRAAADARRAFIYRNVEDPRIGLTSALVAESAGPNHTSRSPGQAVPVVGDAQWHLLPLDLMLALRASGQLLAWPSLPGRVRERLASGNAIGGPVGELFAETPEFLARLEGESEPVRSMQLFPIFCGEAWWGLIGFDEGQSPRAWQATEVAMLRTAGEMIGNTLVRWQTESALSLAQRYDRALAQFSQMLLRDPIAPGQHRETLNEALAHLVTATDASRSYLVQNIDDPDLGPCCCLYAEACAAGVYGHLPNPANQRFPWAQFSRTMRLTLAKGEPYGGATETAFFDAPALAEVFLHQRLPLRSVQFVPVQVDGVWWGFIGFDETKVARLWTEHEVMVLRTAAEMIASTLQRWQAEAALRTARDELESRVAARTAELTRRLATEELLAQSAARLIAAGDVQSALGETLADFGAITTARRVVLVRFAANGHPGSGQAEFLEWATSGARLVTRPVHQSLGGFPWLNEQMLSGAVLTLASARHVPPVAAALTAELDVDRDAPLILVPLLIHNVPLGILVCANIESHAGQSRLDVRAVEIMAGLLTGLLERDATLRTLEARVAERTRELSLFLDFGVLASEESQLTENLELGLEKIIQITRSSAACIHVLDDEARLRLVAAQGVSTKQRVRLRELRNSPAFAAWLEKPHPPLIAGRGSEARGLPPSMKLAGRPHWLAAQLRARGMVVGVLTCYRTEDAEYSINQITLVSGFAEQLGVVVQNERLRQQAESSAVVGERQRLARELHDAVTQSLYSETLFVRSAIDALERGRLEMVGEHLHQLELTSIQALREMRVLLHQMRPFDLAHRGLGEAVEDRLTLVERRVGLAAAVEIDPDIALDQTTEAALYRVILEALNNTLRHAEATRVDVQLHQAADGLVLFVIDDGRGFDSEDIAPGLGLTNIRDRAAQINAELYIDSAPGRGTALMLKVPEPARKTGARRSGDRSRAK